MTAMVPTIDKLFSRVMDGGKIDRDEAMALARDPDLDGLVQAADKIRRHFVGDKMQLCSIMNAKSGGCEEDCKYCAQSSHFFTGVNEYKLVSPEQALKLANSNHAAGVQRFSLVTSGRGSDGDDFEGVIKIYEKLKAESKIHLCASLGIIRQEQLQRLYDTGVRMYHHNLETSRRYFPSICSTHTYQDRIDTIKAAMAVGMDVCSGGIFGMGENLEDRIDMALDIRDLGVKSVPVNMLYAVKGTPLQDQAKIEPDEFFRSVAIFRFLLPDAEIRYAGGRAQLGDQVEKGLRSGISAALVGNYLTTVGNRIPEDLAMFEKAGRTW